MKYQQANKKEAVMYLLVSWIKGWELRIPVSLHLTYQLTPPPPMGSGFIYD